MVEKPASLSLLLDENIPFSLVKWIQSEKPDWKVKHALEVNLQGCPDEEVFNWAQTNKAAILTFDEDFADKRTFSGEKNYGIIRLKIWPTTVEHICLALTRFFADSGAKHISGFLIIIDNHKIRKRKYPSVIPTPKGAG